MTVQADGSKSAPTRTKRGKHRAVRENRASLKPINPADKFYPLEKNLRERPLTQEQVTLTFETIEQILNDKLPASAYEDRLWWGNQKPGYQVEYTAWMDAGWLVETVDLNEKWVRFVRQ